MNVISNNHKQLADILFSRAIENVDHFEACKQLDEAINLFPCAEFYFQKASIMYQDSRFNQLGYDDFRPPNYRVSKEQFLNIKKNLESAIELDNSQSEYYYLLAQVQIDLKEPNASLASISSAIGLFAGYSSYFALLYDVLRMTGDDVRALQAINTAVQMDGQNFDYVEKKCRLLLALQRPVEALANLDSFLCGSTNLYPSYLELKIEILCRLNNYAAVEDIIQLYEAKIDIEQLMIMLYQESHFELVKILANKQHNLNVLGVWITIWACVSTKDFEGAHKYISVLDFENNVSTRSTDTVSIKVSEKKMKVSELKNQLPTVDSFRDHLSNAKKSWVISVTSLFKIKNIPYDILPIQSFIKLLEKLFTQHEARLYFDTVLANCIYEWDTDSNRIQGRRVYGEDYYQLSLKMEVLGHAALFIHTLSPEKIVFFSLLQDSINRTLSQMLNHITNKEKETERNRILSNLSHSIKNLLRSVIDPLLNLKAEVPEKASIIDFAIKGANLIREIVNSINLSYTATIEDLKWDILHQGNEGDSLGWMIISSIKYSISNLFDFRYFPAYAENYYPISMSPTDFNQVQYEWNKLSITDDVKQIKDFTSKYIFELNTELSDLSTLRVGNEKSSSIKLMILFQEIIFNAIKYASFVPRSNRYVSIILNDSGSKIHLEVQNSYRPEVQTRTTGVGKLVIENFARVLGCDPVITTTDSAYSVRLEFENLWR